MTRNPKRRSVAEILADADRLADRFESGDFPPGTYYIGGGHYYRASNLADRAEIWVDGDGAPAQLRFVPDGPPRSPVDRLRRRP